LKSVEWKTAKIATGDIKEEVLKLKQEAGKDILVGSPSLIVTCLNLNLVDELQLCVHPVIAGNGLPLFKNINDRTLLKLVKTKVFSGSGSIVLYYEPTKK
jgi:dihydrofolate reductase